MLFTNCYASSHVSPQAMDKLKTLLDAVGVTYSVRVFGSEEGVAELGGNVFVSNYMCNHCDSPSVCCVKCMHYSLVVCKDVCDE